MPSESSYQRVMCRETASAVCPAGGSERNQLEPRHSFVVAGVLGGEGGVVLQRPCGYPYVCL